MTKLTDEEFLDRASQRGRGPDGMCRWCGRPWVIRRTWLRRRIVSANHWCPPFVEDLVKTPAEPVLTQQHYHELQVLLDTAIRDTQEAARNGAWGETEREAWRQVWAWLYDRTERAGGQSK